MPVPIRRFLWLALAALLGSGGDARSEVEGDRFVPHIEITPDDPGIDDQLTLQLSIEVPADLLVNFPRLGEALGAFLVVGQRALEHEVEATETRAWVQAYRLAPNSTGELLIPPLTVLIQDPISLEATEVSTPPTMVRIASIVPPNTDLRDVRDILPPIALETEAGWFSPWLALGLVPIAFFALAFWRRRREGSVGERAIPQKSPHLAALEALDDLRSKPAIDAPGIEQFHLRLAAVLRRYLQDGFALPAPRKTTEELLQDAALERNPLVGRQELIAKPLRQCDLAKFARHRPTGEAMFAALDDVATLVRETSGLDADRRDHADAD